MLEQPFRKEFCWEKLLNDSFWPSIPTLGALSQRNNSKEKYIFYKDIYSCSYILELKSGNSPNVCHGGEWCTNAQEYIATRNDKCEDCKIF